MIVDVFNDSNRPPSSSAQRGERGGRNGNATGPPHATPLGMLEHVEAALTIFWTLGVLLSIPSVGFVGILVLWIDGAWFILPRVSLGDWGTTVVTLTCAYLVVGVLDIIAMIWLARRIERQTPALVDLALMQPCWPPIFGAAVAAWWLSHYGLSVYVADGLAAFYRNSMTERGNPRVVMHVLSLAVPLIAAVASNFFLLLAAAALVPRRGFVELIWRLRVPIDLVIVLVPFLAHSRWRMP